MRYSMKNTNNNKINSVKSKRLFPTEPVQLQTTNGNYTIKINRNGQLIDCQPREYRGYDVFSAVQGMQIYDCRYNYYRFFVDVVSHIENKANYELQHYNN